MDGQIIKCNGAKLNFDCRPDIPIYVAARGPQMLQKAGKLANGVVIASFATTQGITYGLEQVKKGTNERSPDLGKIRPVSYTYCSLSGDRKVARENVRGGVTLPIFGSSDILTKIGFKEEEVRPLLKFLEENKDKWTFGNPVYEQFLQMVTPAMIDGFSIAGDADLFVTRLKEIEKLGIDNFIAFPFPHTFDYIRRFIDQFSKEVMPRMGH
jgi:5,10-methylenetetrahydromethanopterin reductase